MKTTALRPELDEPIARIARLPLDGRGYPVPWFVARINGEPEFRAMDPAKWMRAVEEQRCWVCGDYLGAYLTFVIGPMCGVNRTTTEPPCHLDCALYSVKNCPFLSRPHMVRREDALTEACKGNSAGTAIDRNPGVTLLWTTKDFNIFDDGRGKPLIHIGDPVRLLFYSQRREATRAEIEASVESGLPILRRLAEQQDREEGIGAMAMLSRLVARFQAYYPAE